MNERRIARLQEQIKQRLAEILQRDLADPGLGLVTITRVELDSEFTQCKAYWSVLAIGRDGEAKARARSAEVLARARGLCQREMGKTLNTRTVPHLEFVHDEGIAGAVRLNQVMHELREEREAREQREARERGEPAVPPAGDAPPDPAAGQAPGETGPERG